MGTSYFFKEPGREEKEKGQEIVKYIGSRVSEIQERVEHNSITRGETEERGKR